MENYEKNEVLQRYNVSHAHSLVYSYEEFKNLEINPDFLLSLLNVFEDEIEFSKETFDKFPLEVIIDYIYKTHHYYLSKKLLEIEQSIHTLMLDYPVAHPLLLILENFYAAYKNNLTKHIEAEESKLLPYIMHLLKIENGEAEQATLSSVSYSLRQFFEHHHDTEKDLREVHHAILQYNPPPTNRTPYRILLSQLEVFEKDLAIHAMIEDEVLIPRAIGLEQKLTKPSN